MLLNMVLSGSPAAFAASAAWMRSSCSLRRASAIARSFCAASTYSCAAAGFVFDRVSSSAWQFTRQAQRSLRNLCKFVSARGRAGCGRRTCALAKVLEQNSMCASSFFISMPLRAGGRRFRCTNELYACAQAAT